jgi:hypothetical protein
MQEASEGASIELKYAILRFSNLLQIFDVSQSPRYAFRCPNLGFTFAA